MSQPTAKTLAQEVRAVVNLLMKRPITEETAMEIKSIEGFKHLEINNGEWVLDKAQDEMTTGERHGWIEMLIAHFFMLYVLNTKAGRIYPGDVTFVLDGEPDNIRIMREPDIAFVAQENITPSDGFIFRAPDLAVEIISPSQTYAEMIDRIEEYFQYGTKQVWLVLPGKKLIEVHSPDGNPVKYVVGQAIPGGDLLPDFTLDVAAVFEK
ncbi:MAG: Uma2 family endonuclease [Anaerolineae bacterium]|nr:Uma2 family endonuclease [Anaerolineae bacterium]